MQLFSPTMQLFNPTIQLFNPTIHLFNPTIQLFNPTMHSSIPQFNSSIPQFNSSIPQCNLQSHNSTLVMLQEVVVFNESQLPKPLTVQLLDAGDNPSHTSDIKVQIAKDAKLKVTFINRRWEKWNNLRLLLPNEHKNWPAVDLNNLEKLLSSFF